MINFRIKEIIFRDFPWEKMPWALDEEGKFWTNTVDEKDPVLILYENEKPLSYLCYHKWINVDINYVQTDPELQQKGYATILVKEIYSRYHKEFVIKANHTSEASARLLQKSGFKQDYPEALTWTLPKQKDKAIN